MKWSELNPAAHGLQAVVLTWSIEEGLSMARQLNAPVRVQRIEGVIHCPRPYNKVDGQIRLAVERSDSFEPELRTFAPNDLVILRWPADTEKERYAEDYNDG